MIKALVLGLLVVVSSSMANAYNWVTQYDACVLMKREPVRINPIEDLRGTSIWARLSQSGTDVMVDVYNGDEGDVTRSKHTLKVILEKTGQAVSKVSNLPIQKYYTSANAEMTLVLKRKSDIVLPMPILSVRSPLTGTTTFYFSCPTVAASSVK